MNFFFGTLVALTASFLQLTSADSFTLATDYSYSNEVATQELLSNQTFGNSWNTPSDTEYSPPSQSFNRVVLELTVNSTGSNFDRLSQLFVDNIEIWRTSTAEPDNSGASWTVRKDVSAYASLFESNRTINFLIKNRVTNTYTGVFYVTLTAHFYDDSTSHPVSDDNWAVDYNNPPSDIQALVKSGSKSSESWSSSDDKISVGVGPLDRSTNRALVHVFASGSGDDEFWWDTPHNSNGAGPSRFVDVYVGGKLAGFCSPYPVIYTGGVDPLLWRPLVDLRTFDVPAYFIDITPFLPALWDEKTNIDIKVTNGINDKKIPSSWIISYNLLTWSTSGQSNSGSTNTPEINSDSDGEGNEVIVTRNITTSASLTIGGDKKDVHWDQDVSYNNTRKSEGSGAHVWQDTTGSSSLSGLYDFDIEYDYPFQAEMNSNSRYHIQQALKSDSGDDNYYTWVDSSVDLKDGDYQSAKSSQWLSFPGGSHFASTENLEVTERW